MGNLCSNSVDDGAPMSQRGGKIGKNINDVSDKDAWKEVDAVWKKHNLKNDESLDFDRAKPFIEKWLKENRGVKEVDEAMITQTFLDMDADGNQNIDRDEMFEFIKKKDFQAQQKPAAAAPKKQNTIKADKKKVVENAEKRDSVYKETMAKIATEEKDMGTLKFDNLPAEENL